jgi:hypothetical protein
MPAPVVGITARLIAGIIAMPAGVTISVPAAVIGITAGLIAGELGVIALLTRMPTLPPCLLAISGPVIMSQAVNVPGCLVLRLVQPLALPGRQAAVGQHPVFHPVDAGLLPVQKPGFPWS